MINLNKFKENIKKNIVKTIGISSFCNVFGMENSKESNIITLGIDNSEKNKKLLDEILLNNELNNENLKKLDILGNKFIENNPGKIQINGYMLIFNVYLKKMSYCIFSLE